VLNQNPDFITEKRKARNYTAETKQFVSWYHPALH